MSLNEQYECCNKQLKMKCTLSLNNEYLYKKVGPPQDLLISFAAAYDDILTTLNKHTYNNI